jgi:hypothetical protein
VELRASELAMILDGIDVTRLARYARPARSGEEALPAGKVPPKPLAISANLFPTAFAPGFYAFGAILPVRFGLPSTLAAFFQVRHGVRWRAGFHGIPRQIHASDGGPCALGNS